MFQEMIYESTPVFEAPPDSEAFKYNSPGQPIHMPQPWFLAPRFLTYSYLPLPFVILNCVPNLHL
jgi:hypothetical protein